MVYKYKQGFFKPTRPEKICRGKPTEIIFRSGFELRVMSFLDTNPSILGWSSECIIIPYFDRTTNRMRRYFPDFEVITKDKKMLIEVKPKRETAPPVRKSKRVTARLVQETLTYGKNECKWEAAQAWCEKNGYQFQILTEDDIFGPGVK